jgi:hypothetical protein
MPYPNEHSCRLHDPGLYDRDSFRRIKQDSLAIIIGKRKRKDTTEAQAYRYPTDDWTEAEARAHCEEAGGTFHPAAKEGKAMEPIYVDGFGEVGMDDLLAAYKAMYGSESPIFDLEVKFVGSPRNPYGTHSPVGYPGGKAGWRKAWRVYLSRVSDQGPIQGTVRRVSMIAAGMKPACNLPEMSAEEVGPRSGGDGPLDGKVYQKPSDYELSKWKKPSDDDKTQADIQLTCADLRDLKRLCLQEIGKRIQVREKKEKQGKSYSMDERRRQVADAWSAQFARPSVPVPADAGYWVKEVFDDQVIVEAPDGLYSYPYTVGADGEVEFGEPVKVEIAYQPVPASKSLAIKMLREEDGGMIVGGPMCLYTDALRKDLQGEYFTAETETWHNVYKSAPALFHHGLDDAVGLSVIGHRVKAEKRDDGLWVEDWLDTSSKYWSLVRPLLEAEALYYSPGSAPHLVKRADDGRLLSYPIIEDTLTPIPAQHRLRPIEQIKAAYKAASIDLPSELEPEPGSTDGGGVAGVTRQAAEQARELAEIELQLSEIELEEL